MYYTYHKRRFPEDILVYVEEFNRFERTVLVDFIDSNEFASFAEIVGGNADLNKPTMVLLKNYGMRTIQENTIYALKRETLQILQEEDRINSDEISSFLIGYNIDVSGFRNEFFNSSVSLSDILDFFLNYYMTGSGRLSNVPLRSKDKISVTVRDVGQGNWNEISFEGDTKIVFDAGAPMNGSRADIIKIIGNRSQTYPQSKPVLWLSHWDKDHYHALLGMTDAELSNNFSAVVCRDRVPNLTSRVLFSRLRQAIGNGNCITIPAFQRTARGGPTFLHPITPTTNQIVAYNSQYHKNRNLSGLILTVKTSAHSMVLSGDVHYEQISRDVLPHLNYRHSHYLVVPHHGGKAGNYIYRLPAVVRAGKAIVSVGTNNYGHPLSSNVQGLLMSGFQVSQTNRVNGEITITL